MPRRPIARWRATVRRRRGARARCSRHSRRRRAGRRRARSGGRRVAFHVVPTNWKSSARRLRRGTDARQGASSDRGRRERTHRRHLFRVGGRARRTTSSFRGRVIAIPRGRRERRRQLQRVPPNSARRTSISERTRLRLRPVCRKPLSGHEAGHRHFRRRPEQPGSARRADARRAGPSKASPSTACR